MSYTYEAVFKLNRNVLLFMQMSSNKMVLTCRTFPVPGAAHDMACLWPEFL
uniref:Uncharacterized protein n=1 Tax=Anguilla anguilla TaxID=7936 RepID=A0A0E9XKV1_ANGAN